VGLVFCQPFNLGVSGWFVCKNNYPVPASQQLRFQPLRVIECFCAESSDLSTVIVGHSSNDLEFFIDRKFRPSISSFSTLCKLI